eukprot:CAMPEP_0118886156 /NCGR_PEP_ID=MMETSP1163-20130328/24347_1 /TAXON_ID=124430 /ORGANISM="Phaeomonas parva, Strain CCMP2877" /LENGTH=80 /DNA_ID=CAMNT_0006824309 /DNA_START=108 /DNA_END=350 /DNA_ORIENTATION=-
MSSVGDASAAVERVKADDAPDIQVPPSPARRRSSSVSAPPASPLTVTQRSSSSSADKGSPAARLTSDGMRSIKMPSPIKG